MRIECGQQQRSPTAAREKPGIYWCADVRWRDAVAVYGAVHLVDRLMPVLRIVVDLWPR